MTGLQQRSIHQLIGTLRHRCRPSYGSLPQAINGSHETLIAASAISDITVQRISFSRLYRNPVKTPDIPAFKLSRDSLVYHVRIMRTSPYPLLAIFFFTALFIHFSVTTAISPSRALGWPALIECDLGTKPPRDPTYHECLAFTIRLHLMAMREPPEAYKFYGRNIGTCSECVDLPFKLLFGQSRCAVLIDINDADEKELSIFGLRELHGALQGVLEQCWLNRNPAKRFNGRGYPGNMPAWAAFVKGDTHRPGDQEAMTLGNRTLKVIDLSQGWPKLQPAALRPLVQ